MKRLRLLILKFLERHNARKYCIYQRDTKIRNVKFEGGNRLGSGIYVNCTFGRNSYVADDGRMFSTKVGRFTSIGPNVRIVNGVHPIDTFVSTHPAFYSEKPVSGKSFVKQNLFKDMVYVEDSYTVSIGSDVWIGANVSITQGVCIGNGAVILANAFVNHAVPAYAVVGGIPAKILRYRYEPEVRSKLLDSAWWSLKDEELEKLSNYYQQPEIFADKVIKLKNKG